jgi:hypothetical protein
MTAHYDRKAVTAPLEVTEARYESETRKAITGCGTISERRSMISIVSMVGAAGFEPALTH